jgi:hypothetical protein
LKVITALVNFLLQISKTLRESWTYVSILASIITMNA